MKLLSICIPTYNRPSDLQQIACEFLTRALEAFPNKIEIIVCDNSDPEIASKNKKMLDPRIRYFRNEHNLGFAGNLLRCTREAVSPFVWIISDNDAILWNGFVELMQALPNADEENIDCFMLPFQTTDMFGVTTFSNRHEEWGLGPIASARDLVRGGAVPFVLFSSAVVRLNKNKVGAVEKDYLENDYVQAVLYLEFLKSSSKVRFTNTLAIDYKPEYKYRFSVLSMADSLSEVRKYISGKYSVSKHARTDYQTWLHWLLHHRAGLYDIRDADSDRWVMIRRVHMHCSLKSLALALLLLLPKPILQPAYIWYRSYRDMQRKNEKSFEWLLERVRKYKCILRQRQSSTV